MIKGSHLSKESRLAISCTKTGVPHTKEHSSRISKALKGKQKSRAHRRAISLAMRKSRKRSKVIFHLEKKIQKLNTFSHRILLNIKAKFGNRNRFRFLMIKKTILKFIRLHKRLPRPHSSHNYMELENWSKKEIKLHYRLNYFTRKGSGYDPHFKEQMHDLYRKLGIR